MLTCRGALIVLLVSVVSALRSVTAAPPELIPRTVFFGNPEKTGVRISPDGERISYVAARDGVLNIWVRTIGMQDDRPVTSATQRPIRRYQWAANGEQIIYQLDRGGDENDVVYAVDLHGGDSLQLSAGDGVRAAVLAADPSAPDEILITMNDRDPRHHDVWRVNTRTGEREIANLNHEGYSELHADASFVIRLAVRTVSSSGDQVVLARDSAEDSWYELVRWGMEDNFTSRIGRFSRDGRRLYLIDSRRSDTGGLHVYDLDAGLERRYRHIASDPDFDVSEVIHHPQTGDPQAVAIDGERRQWVVLDEAMHEDWRLASSLAEGEMSLVDRDDADQKWIVSFERSDGPRSYFLLDRVRGESAFLFHDRPALEQYELVKMKPVTIRARDGLSLVSYLTTPAGVSAKKLPMVLLVHGGPWWRVRYGYNPIHQWLSNRGYAVLSVNFRGSTGFGKRFLNAGDREWSGRMHDDLIDAVNWAVSEKIADPDRVAIMGGSYGGYAALVGLTFTPEFFAAGVDIVGPSHVRTLLESIPPYWEPIRALFERRVGRLDEPEFLDEISPLTHVSEIRRPLLIGQGANDPRVKESESRQIVRAMQERSLPVTYVLFPDEGHGFVRPENNLAFFAIAESFLAEHLGGQCEPMTNELDQSSAEIVAGAAEIPGLTAE